MIKNYLSIAWRNIKRHKSNSIINISGLSIGIACVIFIVMYIKDELGYDRFLKNADRIFQVNMTITDKGVTNTTGGNTAPAVTPTMLSMYPEIESYARIYRPGDVLVRYEPNNNAASYFTEKKVWGVDSNFLTMFDYPLLKGDPNTCLSQPDAIVITQPVAKKYFGDEDPIGKILLLEASRKPFLVTAVLKEIPSQSTFQFDMLTAIKAYPEVKKRSWNWFWLQVNSYVKLKPTVDLSKPEIAKLEAKFPSMVKEHAFNKNYGQSFEEYVKNGGRMEYSLLPYTKVHLYAQPMIVPARLTNLSDIKYIYIFAVVGFFIILLACVNFINLSTAQSSIRAKEVGIRKVLGSEKKQLIRQFLTEAILYSFIAAIIAWTLVFITLPYFNDLSGKTFVYSSALSTTIIFAVLILTLFTGLLAGLYPAFYLTAFKPVDVLKGMKMFKSKVGHLVIRNGLVVLQFSFSITLIICTIVVFQQLKYTQQKDMGLKRENVVEIANTKRLSSNEETFREELTKVPGVLNASLSGSIPTKNNFGDGYIPQETETEKPLIADIGLSSFMADEYFVPTLQMKMLEGRNFSTEFNDSASVILNETAIRQIGWTNPIGKYLDYPGNDQKFKVIGVVKDFNISSFRQTIEPFALFHNSSKTYYVNSSYISVRIKQGEEHAVLARIEKVWKEFAPNTPFDATFLDDEFNALYFSEQRMSKVFGAFTFLSIFVACLGLFGLSIFTAERRRKEIGVRKVLGASVGSLVGLLSKEFLRLVAIASLIAFPIAWFGMNKWLQDFAYRINISIWVFVVAAGGGLLIALLTISFQSIKAALSNPVKVLRSE